MTSSKIAQMIVNSYKTDSGIVMGIPANCQDVLIKLLTIAADMAREESKEEIDG